MEIPLLTDILIVFSLSILVILFCTIIRIPVIVGFLLTGILVGPNGFGVIRAVHEVEMLSEIGVILLLFTIGVEYSIADLMKIKRSVLLGGTLQVGLSVALTFACSHAMGLEWNQSIFLGFLISLSSTAIVLQVLQQRAEIDSPQGRNALAILIYQDVIVVIMMLVTPLLSGSEGKLPVDLARLVGKGALVLAVIWVGMNWVVPSILQRVTKIRNQQLFIITIVTVCIAVTWLTSKLGLSPALGAFLAGLIISESEYSHQALGGVLSFRDVFTSFFFISIGMLLNLNFFIEQFAIVLLITLGVIGIKCFTACAAMFLLGYPLRTSIIVGFLLCQIGEFSFILSKHGIETGLLTETTNAYFLAISILTMAVTPLFIALAPKLSDWVLAWPLPDSLRNGIYPGVEPTVEPHNKQKTDHLIIIGFGINGRNVAKAARHSNIPYVIIEMNPKTVQIEREKGEPIYFGDSTHASVLQHANLKSARVLVVAISDAAATQRTVELARRMNPGLHIITRTRFVTEIETLHRLGADEVIPEEFETSVEIFARVLRKYLVPPDEIDRFIGQVRMDSYDMLRKPSLPTWFKHDSHPHLSKLETLACALPEQSPAVHRTLSELELRKRLNTTVVAIVRDGTMIPNPGGDDRLLPGDIVYLLGESESIRNAILFFQGKRE